MSKKLPYDNEAEKSVLGSILLDPSRFKLITLSSEDFYIEQHKVLFNALTDMYINNSVIDTITIRNYLKDNNLLERMGGENYILALQDSIIVPSHVKHYQNILLEKSKLRKEISILNDGLNKSYNLESCADDVMSRMISLNVNQKVDKPLDEHGHDFITACAKGESGKVNWFTSEWTEHLGRLKNELMLVHAPRSTGKTALILQWIMHLHTHGFKSPLASLEMLRSELVPRFISLFDIDTWLMRTRGFITDNEESRSKEALEFIKKCDFKIKDGGMSIEEIRAWAIAQADDGADIVFIDNLLCITDGNKRYDNRTAMYDHIIHQLKALRDDIKIPVVLLSHPNAEGQIAYSRNVENIADTIIYLQNVPHRGN